MNIMTTTTIRRIATVASLALGLALFVGCASTRAASDQIDDAWITSKVKAQITADPELNPFEIGVDTKDRVVRLTGTVESASDRAEAERIARTTRGVTEVDNDIRFGDPASPGENVSDAWIVTKIKAKLAADPEISPFNIDVDVVRGRVTLSGTVAKSLARNEAERHARSTRGVDSVENLIELEDS